MTITSSSGPLRALLCELLYSYPRTSTAEERDLARSTNWSRILSCRQTWGRPSLRPLMISPRQAAPSRLASVLVQATAIDPTVLLTLLCVGVMAKATLGRQRRMGRLRRSWWWTLMSERNPAFTGLAEQSRGAVEEWVRHGRWREDRSSFSSSRLVS